MDTKYPCWRLPTPPLASACRLTSRPLLALPWLPLAAPHANREQVHGPRQPAGAQGRRPTRGSPVACAGSRGAGTEAGKCAPRRPVSPPAAAPTRRGLLRGRSTPPSPLTVDDDSPGPRLGDSSSPLLGVVHRPQLPPGPCGSVYGCCSPTRKKCTIWEVANCVDATGSFCSIGVSARVILLISYCAFQCWLC